MAQQTPIRGVSTAPSTVNGTTAFQPWCCGAGSIWNTVETDVQQPISCAGTIDYLLINSDNSVSGYAFTIRKNGVSQTLTCSLTSSANSNDKIHSFAVVAGDLISIQCVTGAGASSTGNIRWQTRFTASNPNQSLILGGIIGTKRATSRYFGLQGSCNLNLTTESLAEQIMPCAGTIKNLYTSLSNAQSTDIIGVQVFLNGSGQTLQTSYSLSSATQANDTTHSFTVAAGDRVCVQLTFTSGAGTTNVQTCVEFDPTVNGQSVGMCAAGAAVANNATDFGAPFGGQLSSTITENQILGVTMACTVKLLYAAIPGGATISAGSMVSTFRQNKSDSTLTCSVTSNAQNDSTHTVSTSDGDTVSVSVFNNATGGAAALAFGVVFFIPDTIPIWAAQMYGDEQVRGTLQEAIPY